MPKILPPITESKSTRTAKSLVNEQDYPPLHNRNEQNNTIIILIDIEVMGLGLLIIQSFHLMGNLNFWV